MVNPHLQLVAELLLNPGRLIFGGWEIWLSWLFTRRWAAMLLMLPPLLALMFLAVAATAGSNRDSEQLLQNYWTLVKDELGSEAAESFQSVREEPAGPTDDAAEASVPDATATGGRDSVSPYAELLLQRILQLDTSNLRATYWVARHLGSEGRTGQARWMMRRIAGEKSRGFAPAHAWLAQDRLKQFEGRFTRAETLQLRHDLEVASTWPELNPYLSSVYADLLTSEGKIGPALDALEKAASREPKLRLQLAAIAKDHGRESAYENSARILREELLPKLESQTASAQDCVVLAQLELFDNNVDQAISLATQAVELSPADPMAKRILSDSYLAKYSRTADFEQRRFSLEALDAALKADSSNPKVTDQIARLVAFGLDASPKLAATLEEKLANGEATGITHLLLANRRLLDNQLTEAIGHLQVALRLAPSSPTVLNNLAVALARNSPNEPQVLQRAEQLLEHALKIAGRNAELLDSLGEVRELSGNPLGAIESLEEAIKLDGDRPKTRRRLAAAYRAIGLEDMATVQDKLADKQQPSDSQPASDAAP